jgi:hypothetical protein
MNQRLIVALVALVFAASLSTGPACAQVPGPTPARPAGTTPGTAPAPLAPVTAATTLAGLIAAHAPADTAEFLQSPGDLYFQLQSVEAILPLDYLGVHRAISEERRRFLEAYFERAVKRPEWGALYREEILCDQAGVRYWLPIQQALLGYLTAEAKDSAQLTAHVNLLGVYRAQDGALVNVVILSEFSGRE